MKFSTEFSRRKPVKAVPREPTTSSNPWKMVLEMILMMKKFFLTLSTDFLDFPDFREEIVLKSGTKR